MIGQSTNSVEARTGSAPRNLIGGLFQWSNENRSLVTTDATPTNAIHPYNDDWGRLIKDRNTIRYTPVRVK